MPRISVDQKVKSSDKNDVRKRKPKKGDSRSSPGSTLIVEVVTATHSNGDGESHEIEQTSEPALGAGSQISSIQKQTVVHSARSIETEVTNSPLSDNETSSETSNDDTTESHRVKLACERLCANDYSKMVEILSPVRSTVAISFGLGLAHYKLRKFPSAIQHFIEMEQLAYSDNSQVGNVYLSLYYRGEISFSKQSYSEAARLFHKSVAAFSTNTVAVRYRITPPSKSVVYAKEGASYRCAHRILEAVKAYKNAIAVAESRRDKLSACNSLGNMYQSLGENSSALSQYETAITLAQELGDHVSLGWAHGNIGNAYLGLQNKEKALDHMKKALELAMKCDTTLQAIVRSYNNLGTAYQSMNDLNKAEEYYDLALSQAVYGNDAGDQARVYGNFGNVLMLKKEYDRAIEHYTKAYNLSSDRATKMTALHNRGCASYEKGEANKKKHLAAEGITSFSVTYDGSSMKDSQYHRPDLPESVLKSYRNGHSDLSKVIQRHEESFQTIKGSTHGLTLSVSLFESNFRTFHRVQDCLFNLGELEKALIFAEQSRARSLGELMFERCGKYQQNSLCSPLNIDQIFTVIKSLKSEKVDVVYISYTGARIIVWVISPINSHVEINLFQASLQDDQFEGKSLDYFLRYSLNELLIENHIELYSFCDYEKASEAKHLSKLNDIFGKPLLTILEAVRGQRSIYDIILIMDRYTHLMPVPTLFDTLSHQFLSDRLRVRYMPSLLTMGVMIKMPKVVIEVSQESQNFCIVGNPTIPIFQYQGKFWRLEKLPFATKEAEWVAHILKTTPTLHEQATKMIILSMINSAKVVHLATHSNATADFLAFAGLDSSRIRGVTDKKTVLLYPEEVEKLNISPALVVLSSCDSGRGTVKADGTQRMARAFILAGAQSVLTTLWRIHDESATTFMKFFYQYLMDGFPSSVALHKASLSVRCFAKYSHYVHWSGYRLTGREIQLNMHMSAKDQAVLSKVETTPPFPRIRVVQTLVEALLTDAETPTKIQVIHGAPGVKPLEPVIDFIKKYHGYFSGGIFVIGNSSLNFEEVECVINRAFTGSKLNHNCLVVFHNISTIPLIPIVRSTKTRIIVVIDSIVVPQELIDDRLMREIDDIELKPLTHNRSTLRLVHAIMKGCDTDDFIPYNEEQKMLSLISEFTGGCPDIIDITGKVLTDCLSQGSQQHRRKKLKVFFESFIDVHLNSDIKELHEQCFLRMSIKGMISPYTLYLLEYISLELHPVDYCLLLILHWFGPHPIPLNFIELAQDTIMKVSKESVDPSNNSIAILASYKLLQLYPSAIIVCQSGMDAASPSFYYVPQLIVDAVHERMDARDRNCSHHTLNGILEHFKKVGNHHAAEALNEYRISQLRKYHPN